VTPELNVLLRDLAPDEIPEVVALLATRLAAAWTILTAPSTNSVRIADGSTSDRLLTAGEVSHVLGVPVTHVRELMRTGVLPVTRVGKKYVRVREDSLRRWALQQEQPAALSWTSRARARSDT
jgi:excisionase family DNA binding protein